MGECGCETAKIARVPGSEPGLWYVLEVHPGCRYCGAEWGLGVTEARENTDEWGYWWGEVPVAEFDGYRMWGTTILDPHILHQKFKESTGEEDDFAEAPFALEEFVREGGLRDVFHATQEKAAADFAAYRARTKPPMEGAQP